MSEKRACVWDVDAGTHGFVRRCGRPAKFVAATPHLGDKDVCGVHARKARAWGYAVTPIEGGVS